MKTIERVIFPVLIILSMAAVMILGLTLLDDTNWADGFRGEPHTQSAGEAMVGEESESLVDGILRSVDAFLKVVLFMGIPALFTLRILRITSRKTKERYG